MLVCVLPHHFRFSSSLRFNYLTVICNFFPFPFPFPFSLVINGDDSPLNVTARIVISRPNYVPRRLRGRLVSEFDTFHLSS